MASDVSHKRRIEGGECTSDSAGVVGDKARPFEAARPDVRGILEGLIVRLRRFGLDELDELRLEFVVSAFDVGGLGILEGLVVPLRCFGLGELLSDFVLSLFSFRGPFTKPASYPKPPS